ncbi:hypothetical protein B0J13DRAFT_312776 [Dactylonectria estremocensis]|uniref:Uncharacterized protein n=1 Tax=Dactylonectria estremocensis TaxID=1079267 RepID=A0A9P9J8U2_9HYPO|nr:hypothetical protein B0J13DRAFT_312776 [Dactylonectria estremocensis]
MAARGPSDGQVRPMAGDLLLVIHDFQARSSDELSLSKGDRVELIERDDEFGDGWFLGRHLVNSNTGLFPEVYTRPAPKNIPTSSFASKPSSPPTTQETRVIGTADAAPKDNHVPKPQPAKMSQPIDPPVTLPLNSVKSESVLAPTEPPSISLLNQLANPSQDSPVLHETLTVIDEHITDLRSPQSNGGLRTGNGNDSGSEYSSNQLDHRTSYIHGEETDEEEDGGHMSRAEVEAWSADAVAEYLFTSGVEKHHCEVFRDQEISGEVLLGMDQSSLFIKAFDLGSVGRRLKTWHKIKALQDEVTGSGLETRRSTQTYGSETGTEEGRRTRSRANTLTNRPTSIQTRRLSLSHTPKASPTTLTSMAQDGQSRSSHIKRPSAASIRELHQSRRHSSTEFHLPGTAISTGVSPIPKIANLGTFPSTDGSHKKQPSFDRNWTLGGATPRPLSSTGLQDLLSPPNGADLQDSAVELDRGYFSGTEVDGRKRNLLRKRDSGAESRKSSYAEEQRVRSATAITRQSRFGSMSSLTEGGVSSAAHKYYGLQSGPHRRTASSTTTESIRNMPAAGETPSPTVTKLDTSVVPSRSSTSASTSKIAGFNSDWLSAVVNKPMAFAGSMGKRAISDNQTGSKAETPIDSPSKEMIVESPARTGSTTPSAGPSFDLESPDTAKSPSTSMTQVSKNSRKKGKKETSAYTRGLLKILPKDAMKDADYSGWMKKKSSNLMTTWKPRLFVLKGRRLAYYYSEEDDHEKGLIDISFHRVLPADNEKLTGLHATITGVGSQSMPTTQADSEDLAKGDDAVFIFKLVPPRAGLSRAVNFTKPTVHYFAVPNLKQGRLWMAALMKATIDRDDTKPITTTYQQKTISLAKAKLMRHRPPALMNAEDGADDGSGLEKKDTNGLGISYDEADSGVSGVDKLRTEDIKAGGESGEKE